MAPAPARSDDPQDIRGWQRLDGRITTSGRLTGPDIARLAAIGVARVLNLALADHPEALPQEAALCAAQGIAYCHLPVAFDAPDDRHFAAFCAVVEADDAPLHVHCIMNWRVSAFFYRYHRERLGMDEASARAAMERHWWPARHDHPAAPAWARFIGNESA